MYTAWQVEDRIVGEAGRLGKASQHKEIPPHLAVSAKASHRHPIPCGSVWCVVAMGQVCVCVW